MNNNNNNNNSAKFSTYRVSYIIAGVVFAALFAICLVAFGVVGFNADIDPNVTNAVSGVASNITMTIAVISALTIAFLICNRCAGINKKNNPDIFIPPRDTIYYIKRMGFTVIMIVLMDLAASLVGMCAIALFGGFLLMFDNLLLRELIIRVPIFALYIVLVYRMLIRYGFMDSQRKIFNLNFKILTVIIAFIIMIPGAVQSSFFYVPAASEGFITPQNLLVPYTGVYIVEDDGFRILNENFNAGNVILIAVTVLITFAVQAAVFAFAYNRGKQLFIKQHIREIDYDMDENI